jgi:hypothetical protein
MKIRYILIIYLLSFVPAGAQNLSLTGNHIQVTGQQVDQNSWYFDMGDSVMILMNMQDFNQLITEIRYLQADTTKSQKIIAAKNELIEKFEKYQAKADTHIVVQQELISKADSLYVGYKGLYTDLKKIYGMSKFSIIPGVGLMNPPNEENWDFIGSVGVEYEKWQGQFQFGKQYKAVVIGRRFPIF